MTEAEYREAVRREISDVTAAAEQVLMDRLVKLTRERFSTMVVERQLEEAAKCARH